MSRPGLRSRLSTSMALNSSMTSNARSFSHHTSNSSQQQLVQTESHQASFSSSGWRKSKEIETNGMLYIAIRFKWLILDILRHPSVYMDYQLAVSLYFDFLLNIPFSGFF